MLKGIAEYYSESSDDDDTCESTSDKVIAEKNDTRTDLLTKKRKAPPLPSRFLDLYTSNPKVSENSPLHEGRVRVLPHTEGSWPTHVYLEWMPTLQQAEVLNNILSNLRLIDTKKKHRLNSGGSSCFNSFQSGPVKSLIRSEVGVRLPLHISLSSTLMIPSEQKEEFKNDLTNHISKLKFSSTLHIEGSNVYIVTNQIRSRAFLVLPLTEQSISKVKNLVAIINSIASKFGLPILDDAYTPHVSIAWCSINSDADFSKEDEDLNFNTGISEPIPLPQEPGPIKQNIGNIFMPCSGVKIRMGKTASLIDFLKSP